MKRNMENNLREVYIYMEFKVNFSLKTTSLHSGVVEKNKFIMKNGYKGMATFIYIHK